MTDTLITDGQQSQPAEGQPAATQATEGAPAAPTEGQSQAPAGEASTTTETTEGEKPEGAPEKYEFTAPEGTTLDDATVNAYSEVAKELNLPQDKAQAIISKMAPIIQQQQRAAFEQAHAGWVESSQTDKEFGGDKLNESLATAKKALDTFGSPELKTILNESGLGNHPEVIRAFLHVGKAISEDGFVGGKVAPPAASDARSLYPNSNLK